MEKPTLLTWAGVDVGCAPDNVIGQRDWWLWPAKMSKSIDHRKLENYKTNYNKVPPTLAARET